MGKIWFEASMISARGLRPSSSFFTLQWFAVGWIDPQNKYCTRIDASRKSNPVWKTKFGCLVDESKLQHMTLHIEVYSRDAIFLREKLVGMAAVPLKEFFTKYYQSLESSTPGIEQVASYQLRRTNSSRPKGFIDISINISQEKETLSSHSDSGSLGNEGGFILMDNRNTSSLPGEGGSGKAYSEELLPTNYTNPTIGRAGPSYTLAREAMYHFPPQNPPPPPPPPPPPLNIGYLPTFLPRRDHSGETSSSAGHRRPGLEMGATAGALAAGALIFGDDFMSGFQLPAYHNN